MALVGVSVFRGLTEGFLVFEKRGTDDGGAAELLACAASCSAVLDKVESEENLLS